MRIASMCGSSGVKSKLRATRFLLLIRPRNHSANTLQEGIAGIETTRRFGQERVQKMADRFRELVRTLVRCRHSQIPVVCCRRERTRGRSAAEAVYPICTVQIERRMLPLLPPTAEPLPIQAKDGDRQRLDFTACPYHRLAKILRNEQTSTIRGDRDDLFVSRAARIDKLQRWKLVERGIDVSDCVIRGEVRSLCLRRLYEAK